MLQMAKQARAAMKAKAKAMATDPHEKVDSSDWTPPEPLNTEAKTGMRPVSRRQFKTGGKVTGAHAKPNMGRKPRAKGGAMPPVDRFINRDLKKANEFRDGEKHVGGMKRGGKAYCGGGRTQKGAGGKESAGSGIGMGFADGGTGMRSEHTAYEKARQNAVQEAQDYGMDSQHNEDTLRDATREFERQAKETGYKKGGRTHKDMGGETSKQLNAGVPPSLMQFSSGRSPAWQIAKKGGKIEHPDEAADKQLIQIGRAHV